VTLRNSRAIGCPVEIVRCDSSRLLDRYQQLIIAAEGPVVDTSAAALHHLSGIVSERGYKVTLTGEGSDEGLAGYPWFKFNKLLNCADRGRFRPSSLSRWIIAKAMLPGLPERDRQRLHSVLGGPVAQADMYSLVSASRRRFLSAQAQEDLGDYCAFDEVELDHTAMRRWHPLNRSLYVGYKTQLSGMLLSQKSDRVAMANSLEARYPFLDEAVVDFVSRVPPEWKLKGLFHDKHLLRRAAEGLVPREVARQPKKMFRAPFGDTVLAPNAPFVRQLLSEESILRAGYFCPRQVELEVQRHRSKRWSPMRCFNEMALVAIFATQLWHHTFIDDSLCELPGYQPPSRSERSNNTSPTQAMTQLST
jgi:asparagine synthase (glutamine-hydrolysing)